MSKSNKYPQGYLPKIQYWTDQLIEATANEDLYKMQQAKSKLDYFYSQQVAKVALLID
jgi:hypothetical protein